MLNSISFLVNSCFKDRIGRGFYITLWPATKNGSTTIISNADNHGECPDMPPHRRPDRIFMAPRLCSAFGGTNSVWSVNRVKPSQGIGIKRNWCVFAEHWRRNDHSSKRDTTKLSSSMTMLAHMSQDWSRHTWKRWNGISYPTRYTHQALLLPNKIFFDWWYTGWVISISALMKKSKNESIPGSPQKTHRFFEFVSGICQKDGKK